MDNLKLKELVGRMKNGDMSVFDEFYNLTKQPIFYNIVALTKDYYIAEDLLQDTFVKFLKNLKDINENSSILGFLMVMSKNITLDYFKKANRTREIDEIKDDMSCKDEYNVDKEILLMKIKEVLKEKEFIIFTMHVLSELTFKEIAEELNKPLGTVLWSYNNAIKKLQKELDYE